MHLANYAESAASLQALLAKCTRLLFSSLMRITAWLGVLLSLAVSLPFVVPLAKAAETDLALVMALDVSKSIDTGEYRLQHEGIAHALENPAVLSAIVTGPHHSIDIAVMEWSDRDKQVIIVPWMRVSNKASAAIFAARIDAAHRTSNGLTAIGDALRAAAAMFKTLDDNPTRRVIDLSGDGMANIGPNPAVVRDALVARGISINGLAILNHEPWLSTYYDQNVIGGTGSFLLDVQNLDSFVQAMQQKLINEISALPLRQKRPDRARSRSSKARPANESGLDAVSLQRQKTIETN